MAVVAALSVLTGGFLLRCGVLAVGVVETPPLCEARALARGRPAAGPGGGGPGRGDRVNGKVMLVDQRLCDGCGLCVVACSLAHTGVVAPERAHIRCGAARTGFYAPLTLPPLRDAVLRAACPTKACRLDVKGRRVIIDERLCIGCRACNVACPFGHAHYDTVARVSAKCDYCDGRPECVRVCEPGAIRYVYSDESSQHKRRRAAMVEASRHAGALTGREVRRAVADE